jgi:outer membrane protein assembly factor BamB
MFAGLRARAFSVWIAFFLLAAITSSGAQVAVTTWHYDNGRSGANSNETTLTPQNVNSKDFGKLFTQPVDGAVIGQALYLPGVTIPNAGVHNVVYLATMHNSVYAFDADTGTGKNAHSLWHRSFLKQGTTSVPIAKQGCGGVTQWTEVGIVSTPVIDPVAGTLFVVAKTYENSAFVHRVHALDVATGREKTGSPIVITATYEFTGTVNVFKDVMEVNRPALLLESGYLYIAFGSNGCRNDHEQGWVVAYDAATLQPAGAFDVEPGESAAALWMRGGGLSSDTEGNIYAATADGPFMAGTNFGQSVIKLSQSGNTLNLADWFTPFNEAYLDQWDLDMSEPVLVLPDQAGKHPHELVTLGKEGTIYLLNRDSMGHFCATCTKRDSQIVQELTAFAPESGALVYWNNAIYSTGTGLPISALSLTNGRLANTPFAQSKKVDTGHSPVISANGNTSGILWEITGGNLTAFDAITLVRLYSTIQAPNGRDALPPLPHFANQVVANGKVYVGTNNSLVVFGLL